MGRVFNSRLAGGKIFYQEKRNGNNNRYLKYKEVYHGKKHCLDRCSGTVASLGCK